MSRASSTRTVLVLSNSLDLHTDAVIHFLDQLRPDDVSIVRWHTSEAGSHEVMMNEDGAHVWIPESGREFSTSDVISCWYRRPRKVKSSDPMISSDERLIVGYECNTFIQGVYGLIDGTWYSHPYYMEAARNKPYQLLCAKRMGFKVPPYVLSNRPEKLREFLSTQESVVCKPISESTNRVDLNGDGSLPLLVQRFGSRDPVLLEAIEGPLHTPLYLQSYVQKRGDVRMTVIGREIYPVMITPHGTNEEVIDWRPHVRGMRVELIPCPSKIRDLVYAYMAHMGLNFSCFDFSVDTDGEWHFLEANVNGQFVWLEAFLDLELGRTMAEHLLGHKPPLVAHTPSHVRSNVW